MNNYIMVDTSPPILLTINKFHPLILTIIGSSIAIILTYLLIFFWKLIFKWYIIFIHDFFSRAWYWDPITKNYLINSSLGIGFSTTYKLLDNQFIEMLGPYGGSNTVVNYSSQLSQYHIGKMSSYSLALITFIYILLILLLILEN